jgi:hypothetical protein
MLYVSFQAIAPLGHIISVGRMEVSGSKTVDLEFIKKSANFSYFDLSLILNRNPELRGASMKTVAGHLRAGRKGPIQPSTVSGISKLDQMLLGFSKGA